MNNENILNIEPQKGLGFFKLESNINFIISEIRSRGERYEHCEIIAGENCADPIYFILVKEGIKLRFDYFYQKLELIEIDVKKDRTHEINYKGNSILSNINKEHNVTYNYINSIFGPSNVPKLIDNNKYLLLRYEGISFTFENTGLENEESIILGSDASLSKIAIFSEKYLIDSISKDNLNFKTPIPTIRTEIDKGICISYISNNHLSNNIINNNHLLVNNSYIAADSNLHNENENLLNDININIGESLENILYKLKNPNYVFYKKNQSENYENEYSDTEFYTNSNNDDCDFFVNYYSYGFDILIDAQTQKAKKIILHTNNPYDVKFGVYNRCNFIIDLNKNFFRKLEKYNENTFDRESVHVINSRKVSVDSYKSASKNNYACNSEEKEEGNISVSGIALNYIENNNISLNNELKIEKNECMEFNPQNIYKDIYSSNLGYKENYTANISKDRETVFKDKEENYNNIQYLRKRRETAGKSSFDKENLGEKSFGSINESNLSISLNNSDIYMGISICPTTNFNEIINRLHMNSYVLYHRHESKLNSVTKYYAFDGVIFEVLENNLISSVTIFNSSMNLYK